MDGILRKQQLMQKRLDIQPILLATFGVEQSRLLNGQIISGFQVFPFMQDRLSSRELPK